MKLGDFSEQADTYARARPGYPPAMLAALLIHTGARAGDALAEIGAGTGLFTRLLSGLGLRVTAIEPNASMRSHAPELPDVTWRDGTFESTGLASGSQRWVVAAQAFHWADTAKALPELWRVLVPGGHFTALWNNRENERSPVLAWTQEAIRRHAPDFDDTYRDACSAGLLIQSGHFSDTAYHEVRHVVPMSRSRYLDLWRSHNRLNVLAGPERFAAFMAEMKAYLEACGIETVEVPYLCRAWTVRRVDGCIAIP
jgi:SAM-dependent methyltransferase